MAKPIKQNRLRKNTYHRSTVKLNETIMGKCWMCQNCNEMFFAQALGKMHSGRKYRNTLKSL